MTQRFLISVIVVAAAAILAAPAASLADSVAPVAGSYATSLTQTGVLAAPGAYEGTLRLNVSSHGTVGGWYTPYDSGDPVLVTGGLHDGSLWLDIGDRGELHINATQTAEGKLVGTATEFPVRSTTTGPATFDFVAEPAAAN